MPVKDINPAFGLQPVETAKHYLTKFSSRKTAKETDIDVVVLTDTFNGIMDGILAAKNSWIC